VPEELLDTEELSSERVAGLHAQMNCGETRQRLRGIRHPRHGDLTATVCGGGGTALLLSGPLGLVLGALLGIFLAMAGKKAGKNLPLPGLLTRHLLSEKAIDTCLDDAKQTFAPPLSFRIDKGFSRRKKPSATSRRGAPGDHRLYFSPSPDREEKEPPR
jgi:hypothetical protein